MTSESNRDITCLLEQWRNGDEHALSDLMPLVYAELHAVAARHMRGENANHTLETTALVHEAYLKMIGAEVSWQNRAHFFAIAAKVMRHVLVDHARTRHRAKRGGGAIHISLDRVNLKSPEPVDVLDIHEALNRLAEFDSQKAHIIELLFFAGLSQDEAAGTLRLPLRTLERDLKLAKAWLFRELRRKSESNSPIAGS